MFNVKSDGNHVCIIADDGFQPNQDQISELTELLNSLAEQFETVVVEFKDSLDWTLDQKILATAFGDLLKSTESLTEFLGKVQLKFSESGPLMRLKQRFIKTQYFLKNQAA
ncbi:MAG: hypothetical protein OXR68_04575 [Alphaproteobacteria bacterium]|nr:hypothetical protein [Alphaproteobacteria bacterium]MDD9919883.1 hypothetical protein [Alphaproteobacteria bacterium]